MDEGWEDENEPGGYYSDGAYTSAPAPDAIDSFSLPLLQRRYYDSMLLRHDVLRAKMKLLYKSLEDTTLQSHNSKLLLSQQDHFHRPPLPLTIARLSPEEVLEIIRDLQKRLGYWIRLQSSINLVHFGAWVWAVLAKCPDRGELGSEEIAEIRALAQEAIKLQRCCQLPEVEDHSPHGAIHSANVREHMDLDECSELKQHMLTGKAKLEAVNEETQGQRQIILDVIITIVGEVYGQRDLLKSRRAWQVASTCM